MVQERGVECVTVSSLSLYWRHGMHCGFNPKCGLWQPLELLHSTTQALWELIHEGFGMLPPFLDAVQHMFTAHVLNMCWTCVEHVLYRYCTLYMQNQRVNMYECVQHTFKRRYCSGGEISVRGMPIVGELCGKACPYVGRWQGTREYSGEFMVLSPSSFLPSPGRKQGTRKRWRRGAYGTSPLLYCSFSSKQCHTNYA